MDLSVGLPNAPVAQQLLVWPNPVHDGRIFSVGASTPACSIRPVGCLGTPKTSLWIFRSCERCLYSACSHRRTDTDCSIPIRLWFCTLRNIRRTLAGEAGCQPSVKSRLLTTRSGFPSIQFGYKDILSRLFKLSESSPMRYLFTLILLLISIACLAQSRAMGRQRANPDSAGQYATRRQPMHPATPTRSRIPGATSLVVDRSISPMTSRATSIGRS